MFDLNGETSRFGIASEEFAIPDSMKFGTYTVEAILNSGEAERTVEAGKRVRISKYELPTFSVNAKPDRPYYLAGQSAEVTVSADYLFGKPVAKGKARGGEGEIAEMELQGAEVGEGRGE